MIVIIECLLKNIRIKKKISLRKLEELTGISKTLLNNIENNDREVTVHELVLLSSVLEVEEGELVKIIKII